MNLFNILEEQIKEEINHLGDFAQDFDKEDQLIMLDEINKLKKELKEINIKYM